MNHYFTCKRRLEDLLHVQDDSGYIEGRVFMTWPPRNQIHRIKLEVHDDALYRFEVEIPHADGVAFRPHDLVRIALKGVQVVQRKESNASDYFPATLRFPDGAIFTFVTGPNADRVVNTWHGNTDEWYNTPPSHCKPRPVTVDTSGPNAMSSSPQTEVTVCEPVVPMQDATTVVPSKPAKVTGYVYRRRGRRRRRLVMDKAEGESLNQRANGIADVTPHAQTSIHALSTNVSDSRPHSNLVNGRVNGETSNSDNQVVISHDTNHVGEPGLAPRFKAGFCTERGDVFTALSELPSGQSIINVIGIVINARPEKKTRSNEWCKSITLTDPSIGDSAGQRITVNCFQKKYSEWLPQVQKDDIVILRKLKVVNLNGTPLATGYGDKLRWGVYDPLTHAIRPPNRGDAPEKETLDEGMGYEYSPYWEPFENSVELDYCRQIAEWAKSEQLKVSAVQCSVSVSKQHLLISEASPDLPPKGYFNCTVEVLQKFDNCGGATTVYFTDYTANGLLHPVQATWCPPQLSDCVLQCSMWDDARSIAKTMNPGEYWYLHNVRAKWNPNNTMEGTMQLAEKVTRLDETDFEKLPHLKALLARRKERNLDDPSGASGSGSLHIFPEMLLQDVEDSTNFVTCIVELLYVDLDSRDGHFLYATDYTYNPDLPTSVSAAAWAHNLDHRVIKIKLDDIQANMSSNLRRGSMYIIRNLRIKHAHGSGGMHGCLGGVDTLVVSVNDPSSHHAQTLQRNKEKWQRENSLHVPTTTLANGSHELSLSILGKTTLQEALTWPAPAEFKVLARVIDFFPFSLEDAAALRCTKCESSPPPSFKRCPRCDDMMETHCKWFYCLYVLLQDGQGNELTASLSGDECTLFRDVAPTDFRHDRVAFRTFMSKLDPILGNLQDVHTAWSRNEDKAVESPWTLFSLESWNIGEEKGYGLLDCTPA